MKIIIAFSVLMVIFIMLLPVFVVKGVHAEHDISIQAVETEPVLSPEVSSEPAAVSPNPAAPSRGVDTTTMVKLKTGDSVVTLTMYDYLVGVVAAEMPASFYEEALKAQAVAARTYTYYKMLNGSNHSDADVCDNCNCCKAYFSYEALREKWGEKYDYYIGIISKAVADTDGLCVTYEDEPILAAFHSSSPGYTENSESVWHSPLPYLVSVESPENGNTVPNFYTEVIVSFEEFKSTVKKSYPLAVFDTDQEGWISDAEYSDSGRIIKVRVGGVEMTGTELRGLFELRSTAVRWSVGNEYICFEVTGYGHGVGMSQYGANEFAKNGADFFDILSYYYRGTSVKSYLMLDSDKKLL
ncbi:MAG: stage II sporulation protein D [Clostridiales bacterium]|nr:stage II sporulation protein D [Clostridiales bacterium]